MSNNIAKSARVDPGAELGRGVVVGEFCSVQGGVQIGDGTRLGDGVRIRSGVRVGPQNTIGDGTVIQGRTVIGCGNRIHEYCVLGGEPLVSPLPTTAGSLQIGSDNVIREFCTFQVGSHQNLATQIGDNNFVMPHCQVGHDSIVGTGVTMTNYAAICGHVVVQDHAVLGMGVIVHQRCRIGELAMVGASAYVSQDIPPFTLVDGRSGYLVGLNLVGLRRSQMESEERMALKQAYRQLLCNKGNRASQLERMVELQLGPATTKFIQFILASKRGIASDRRDAHGRRAKATAHLRVSDPATCRHQRTA